MKKLLALLLIPAIAFAQPSGGHLNSTQDSVSCKLTDSASNSPRIGVASSFASPVILDTDKGVDTNARFHFKYDSGYSLTPGADNKWYDGVMNDFGDFMVGIGSVKNAQILTGNGTTGTGSPRVTISSNNTPFAVKTDQTTPGTTDLVHAAQSGSWTNACTQSGAWNVGLNSGSNVIGKVGIDQTTHGTTDKVAADLYQGGSAVALGNPAYTQLVVDGSVVGTFGSSIPMSGNVSIVPGSTIEITGSAPASTTISAVGQTVSTGYGTTYYKAVSTASFWFATSFAATHTVVFEVSADGTNWLSALAIPVNTTTNVPVTSATGTGAVQGFIVPLYGPGYTARARCTVYSGSSFSVTAGASPLARSQTVLPIPPGTNSIGQVTANAGTNLNTSALALETGGNLASVKTNTDALGTKTDNKSTATDTTAISIVSILKQISASVQAPPTQAASQSGTWTVQPGNTANTTPWLVQVVPATSGGLTKYHLVSAASTNATNVKASAGQLCGWYIYNSNAAVRKVAFHDTSGTPTAGASVYFSFPIPPGGGANTFTDHCIPFTSGIGITAVTGLADSDATAVAANDLVINLFYK